MDLHLHTPASSDYQEPGVTFLDILHTAEARGLEMIAFTDHNTVAGVRKLREEIANLELLERLQRLLPEESDRLAEYRRLAERVLVLPGFEFTATFGFHIVGIFSPETSTRDLEHLLLSLRVPPDQLDRGAVAVGATVDVLTAYRLISEAGGLAIAAHANSTNGVAMRGFGFGGQTKIAFTQDPYLCALEVTDLDLKGKRSTSAFFSGTKPEYPRRMHCITGSDAHRLARDPNNVRNLGVGDRATEVLLEEPSFEALKALFQASDFARVRVHVAGGAGSQAEFDPVQQAREEGPNLVQAFHESLQQRGGRQYAVISDVCAFANTNGGTIYVGVPADPKQAPTGVPDLDQGLKELRSALARMVTPQLNCTVDVQETRGKKIVRILVPRGDDPPYAIDDNRIFVREEAETSLAVRDEIVQLVQRGRAAQPAAPPAARPATPEPAAPHMEVAPAETRPRPAPAAERPAPAAPVGRPRTGVEIADSEERDGVLYHTMRDLRNGSMVKNVTQTSARKLWHYAIMSKESGGFDSAAVNWLGDIGLWRRTQKGGATRYDLVQRAGDEVRIYYGVTEEGVHGAWRALVERDERQRASTGAVPAPVTEADAAGAEPAAQPAVGLETAAAAATAEAVAGTEGQGAGPVAPEAEWAPDLAGGMAEHGVPAAPEAVGAEMPVEPLAAEAMLVAGKPMAPRRRTTRKTAAPAGGARAAKKTATKGSAQKVSTTKVPAALPTPATRRPRTRRSASGDNGGDPTG